MFMIILVIVEQSFVLNFIYFLPYSNVFNPLEAEREKLLLVKKADMDMSSTNNNIIISASEVKNPKNEEAKIVLKSTPTPRSFSDIFTGPKLVLVQKSMVQNKSEKPPISSQNQNLNASLMPSTPNPLTTSSMASTTKSTTTDRVITTTYSTSTSR